MDRAHRKALYNRLLASDVGVLDGYVDVDGFGSVRGERAIVDELIEDVRARVGRPVGHPPVLVTAAPGSGLTTELRRVARRIEAEDACVVVQIDARSTLDLTAPLDARSVAMVIVRAVERASSGLDGPDDERASARFWRALEIEDVDRALDEIRLGKLHRAGIDRLSDATFLSSAREALLHFEWHARARARRGVVVVLDGLEAIAPLRGAEAKALAAAERLHLLGGLAWLPFPMLVAAPPGLYFIERSAVHVLPAIKLHERDGARFDAGQRAAHAILESRASRAELTKLFGADVDARVDAIVESSAGLPGDLLASAAAVLEGGPSILDDSQFRAAIHGFGGDANALYDARGRSLLERIGRDRYATIDASEAEVAQRLVQSKALVPYRDGSDVWFDVNPTARSVLRLPT